VLNGRLALNGIHDVEAFCAYIIQRSRLTLTPQDHEDALAYLIEETWILSQHHRPGAGTFTAHAATRLPQRLIDWQRKRKDTRYPSNTRYTEHSLDHLDRPHTHTSHHDPRDRDARDLVRVLRTRSRPDPRHNHHADQNPQSPTA
jgi:hypothetical protein